MNKSIKYYFFAAITAVLISSMLIMGIIQIYLSTTYFRREKEIILERAVNTVSAGSRAGLITFDEIYKPNIGFMAQIAGANIFIADDTGLVVFSSTSPDITGVKIPDKIIENIDNKGSFNELGNLGGFFDKKYYSIAIPLEDADGNHMGYVIASSDADGLAGYISDMMSSFILSAALVMLISSIPAFILSQRMVVPIKRVSSAAQQFADGNYSARVPVEGSEELVQLALTFNEMAKSFEAADSSRRSFMGNIAHELRTPMTTIKGFIDGMLDGTIPEDQRDKYLKIVSSEVGRLARLTQNMLDVSRLESGEYTPNTTSFDIWGPIASVFISAQQRLEEKSIELEGIDVYPPIYVLADADFVHQILYNITDNAIKFTDNNGKIVINVKNNKNIVTISISNTGAGIPQDSLSTIFDRFYKGDKSRGINTTGSGLGLHICKVLLGLMGGRIWAESSEEGPTTFNFTLPADTAVKRNIK